MRANACGADVDVHGGLCTRTGGSRATRPRSPGRADKARLARGLVRAGRELLYEVECQA